MMQAKALLTGSELLAFVTFTVKLTFPMGIVSG
jgi:hypothetical protein